MLADELDRAVDVARSFRMKRDVGGAGFREVGHDAVHRLDHEMHVDRRLDAVLAQCRAHERPDRKIRHIVIVHHVEVHDIRTRSEHGFDLLAQAREVGRQNRRRNPGRLHGAFLLGS